MDFQARREAPGGQTTSRRGNLKALKLALRHRDRSEICQVLLAETRRQGIMRVAKLMHTTRGSLSASFGPDGNPTLERLLTLIDALDVDLALVEQSHRARQAEGKSQ